MWQDLTTGLYGRYHNLQIRKPPIVVSTPRFFVHFLAGFLQTVLCKNKVDSQKGCIQSFQPSVIHAMDLHPTGVVINIVGINPSSNGRSCEEHQVCGSVLKLDSIVRFREVQIIVKGKEETTLVVYWVTDGVDCCHVGFLPRHMVKYKEACDGRLAQVVEFLSESNIHEIHARNHRGTGVC